MQSLAAWSASQGLSIARGALGSALAGDQFEKAALDKLETVESKLDILIDAPFREAKMYLQEGDLVKCKERIVNAIAHNELNLAAQVLYCLLLIGEKKYDAALDRYGEILRRFGVHRDMIPDEVLDLFSKYSAREDLVESPKEFSVVAGHDCYPRSAWCSPWHFASLWEDTHWSSSIFRSGRYRLLVYDWHGVCQVSLKEKELSLWGITGEYALWGRTTASLCV